MAFHEDLVEALFNPEQPSPLDVARNVAAMREAGVRDPEDLAEMTRIVYGCVWDEFELADEIEGEQR